MTSTICLIAKNEEQAILEWLAYQCVVGFDRICIYDNGSTDSTASLIKKIASAEPGIEYTFWPDRTGQRPQPTAYADAIARCTTEWIAFFDTDEFIVLQKQRTINDYLASFPPNVSGIAINWLVFGSGGFTNATQEPVIDRFTRCADPRHGKNRICKSILRAKNVETMLVHTAQLKSGIYTDSLGRPISIENNAKTPEVCFGGAQLNHYLLKSREEFLRKKARGHSGRSPEEKDKYTHIDEEFWVAHDLNDSEDHKIKKWRDAVVARLSQWAIDK
jgi:hypothetical protein